MLRASQSIALNIAAGNGRRSGPDRRRFFEIARGSAFECASVLDILVACETTTRKEAEPGKRLLLRIVSRLSKLSAVVAKVREESMAYGTDDYEHEHRFAEDEHEG